MGAMKENPRYNVISCRISDRTKAEIDNVICGRSMQTYLHDALEEKMTRDRQRDMDEYLRSLGGAA